MDAVLPDVKGRFLFKAPRELDFGPASATLLGTGKPAGSATRDRIIKYEVSVVKEDVGPKIEAIATFPKKKALKKEKRRSS